MAGFLLPGINLMRPKNSISSSSLASSDSIVSEFVSIMRTAENLSASASPSFSRLPNVRGGHSEIVPGLPSPVFPSNLPDAADYDAGRQLAVQGLPNR